MKNTQELERELKKLKIKSNQKGTYRSIFITMGIIGIGLPCTLYNERIGIAILMSGVIPLLIKPETFSGNKRKIENLENKIEKNKQKAL